MAVTVVREDAGVPRARIVYHVRVDGDGTTEKDLMLEDISSYDQVAIIDLGQTLGGGLASLNSL